MIDKGLSEGRSLLVVGMSPSAFCYQPVADQNTALKERIIALAHPSGVQRQNLVVEAGPAGPVLWNQLRLEEPWRSQGISIGDSPNSPLSVFQLFTLHVLPAGVLHSLVFAMAEMLGHLCF